MKVSLNTIKQFIDFDLPPVDELVARINAQLGGVEEVIDLAAKHKDAKIVKVVECEKHPNADKLSVCKIDVGDDPLYSKFYIPNSNLIQVVCGANNVHAGMWAVWLPPQSTVPATFDDPEPFVLSSRELRGEMSNGMLASARELGIGDDHDGIVELSESDLRQGSTLTLSAGASFAEVFGLDDTVVDIENKMFTHRPDLFGQLGVAREIAGIFGKQFTSPDWYLNTEDRIWNIEDGKSLQLEVFNDAIEGSPRFMAVAISGVEVKPSPMWLQCALVSMGGKPINNIVDATNYIMLMTAQPVHAYDYAKLRGHKLGVRMANEGEQLTLLNGKTYELSVEDIVIADDEGAIGLAGIMGGANSEVSAETSSIVLEVANFDMYTVRRSSMRHGLFTDALTRFNKGQSSLQNPAVLASLMKLIGGQQASDVFDLGETKYPEPVRVSPSFINSRLGLKLRDDEIKSILTNVEIVVDSPDDHDTYFDVQPPFWRTDIGVAEDIVEEVGRLYGYGRLPHELPYRSTRPVPTNASLVLKRRIRESLARGGANEVLTYSFVHERIIKSAMQEVSDAYQLSNALSPDLQYYRLSITPSLLDKVHSNIKAGHGEFALFEIGKSHSKNAGFDDQDLPLEPGHVALVYASKNPKQGAAFYRAKSLLEFLSGQLGVELAYEALSEQSTSPVVAPFEAKRSAVITDRKTGIYIGVVGEYKKSVARNFKLPEYVAGFELGTEVLIEVVSQVAPQYRPLSRFPSVERDISLKTSASLNYDSVAAAVEDAFKDAGLQVDTWPLGVYRPEGSGTKNTTFRLKITSHERTLASEEVNQILKRAASHLESSIDAEIV